MARPRLNDIIGNKYNYLLVTGRSTSNNRKFVCVCDCGKITETTKQRLISGRTKSCGCKNLYFAQKLTSYMVHILTVKIAQHIKVT